MRTGSPLVRPFYPYPEKLLPELGQDKNTARASERS